MNAFTTWVLEGALTSDAQASRVQLEVPALPRIDPHFARSVLRVLLGRACRFAEARNRVYGVDYSISEPNLQGMYGTP